MQKFISFLGLAFCLFLTVGSAGQPASARPFTDSLQVSLLTCGSGPELYATFGHSAVRVTDFTTGDDYVFNYGTFDFTTPHFYWKFMRGRLLYFLSVQDFPVFLQAYQAENRSVTEQVLNLSTMEKQAIFNALKNNYRPENRYYKYDFLFDNCSTRIWDIFSAAFDSTLITQPIIPVQGLTFRAIINTYLEDSPWERLGINLMFGVRADREMTNRQIMFLPHFLMEGAGHSTLQGKAFVKKTNALYTPSAAAQPTYPFYKQPLLWLSLLAAFVLLLSLAPPTPFSIRLTPWIDRCLYFLTGLLGCFLLFMWWGTDHKITVGNYNILWLLPFNLLFSFFFFKNTVWVRRYARLLLGLNIVLLGGWWLVPQQLPLAALPVIAMLSVRAWRILTRPKAGYR